MKLTCRFENKITGEQKDLICKLDPDEIEAVESVRRTDGDEIARITAACIVLKSAYADLDPRRWVHLNHPERLQ